MKNILLHTRLFYKYQFGIMIPLYVIALYFNRYAVNFVLTNLFFLLFLYRELYSAYFVIPEKCNWQKSAIQSAMIIPLMNIFFVNNKYDYDYLIPFIILVTFLIIRLAYEKFC